MEGAYRATENALFYNIPATSFARNLASGYPVDLSVTNPNDSVAKVDGGGQKVGPAIILKVMSGDVIKFGVNYFFNTSGATNGQSLSPTDVINSLASGIVSMAGGAHGSFSDLTGPSTPLTSSLSTFLTTQNPTNSGKPNAYLNWVLFDNQLAYDSVGGQSGAQQVATAGTASGGGLQSPLGNTLTMKNSGYLYIYVSNATPNWDVFFDNLSIQHFSGPMLEETHYYPFGLTMAGINDKALKANYAENKYRYNKGSELQNKEFSDGSGLEMYETPLRSLDPQLGRWWQIDPKADFDKSPYIAMNNNPSLFNDLLGDTIKFNGGNLWGNVAIAAGLAQLNKSKTGAQSIDHLARSHNFFTITLTNGKSHFQEDDVNKAYKNEYIAAGIKKEDDPGVQGGSGGTIFLNSAESVIEGEDGNYVARPGISLGHELLGHALDADNGDENDKKVKGLEISEYQATHQENKIRSELAMPLRTWYGGSIRKNLETGEYQYQFDGVKLIKHGSISTYYLNYEYKKLNPPLEQSNQ